MTTEALYRTALNSMAFQVTGPKSPPEMDRGWLHRVIGPYTVDDNVSGNSGPMYIVSGRQWDICSLIGYNGLPTW